MWADVSQGGGQGKGALKQGSSSSQEAIYTLLRTPGQELVFQTWEVIGASCDLGRMENGETCLEKKKKKIPEKAQIMSGRGRQKEQNY